VIVQLWGGPQDGKTLHVPDDATHLRVACAAQRVDLFPPPPPGDDVRMVPYFVALYQKDDQGSRLFRYVGQDSR